MAQLTASAPSQRQGCSSTAVVAMRQGTHTLVVPRWLVLARLGSEGQLGSAERGRTHTILSRYEVSMSSIAMDVIGLAGIENLAFENGSL